ncbi:hypothetical protein M9434_001041 [Picochlorum sp. BPE23]|nr:hypothetical protein M9434_001041 [Picochlorum sp. BPE23]
MGILKGSILLGLFFLFLSTQAGVVALQNAQQQALAVEYRHADMRYLVERAGYPVEEHFIETRDGYVLGVYRILPQPTAGAHRRCRKPVILQHGLLDSSATWVVNSKSQSLGFILADASYDTWLTNSRGNAFSRNHTGFLPDSKAFWDFTFDDMAAYDLPAVVEYVIGKNADSLCPEQKVALIAHSQGTTLSFAAFSSNRQLQDKISIFIALAPAVYTKYVSSVPLQFLARMHADTLVSILGEEEFLPSQQDMSDLFGEFCTLSPESCISILTAICGFNPNNVDVKRLPVYLAFAPSGTSVKNMRHWAQQVRRAEETAGYQFCKFDYGDVCTTPSGAMMDCNQREYGSVTAPCYGLDTIQAPPIAMFYGTHDKLADPMDVQELIHSLPRETVVFSKKIPGYEHIDFTWGTNAHTHVYNDILVLL